MFYNMKQKLFFTKFGHSEVFRRNVVFFFFQSIEGHKNSDFASFIFGSDVRLLIVLLNAGRMIIMHI